MKLFERKKDPSSSPTAAAGENPHDLSGRMPVIQSQICQSVGKVRSHNEDAVFSLNVEISTSANRQSFGLFMLADGMGGHLDGEVASNLAIEAAAGYLMTNLLEPLRLGHSAFSDEEIEGLLEQAMQAAQDAVVSQVSGGGTTLTLALLLNSALFFAHVGDSRLYLLSGKQPLQLLTKDHSVVQRQVDLGQISPKEAANHPKRNALYRAVGQVIGFKADLGHLELPQPAILLLCSDGLWGLVEDANIAAILMNASHSVWNAQALVDAANQAGGTDNISVIIVTIS